MTEFLDAFRQVNSARWQAWAQGREPDPLFMAVELGGEAGEVLNEVKKLVREERGWVGSRTTVQKLADELADVMICVDFLAWAYGIDLAVAVTRKFNATSEKVGLPHRIPVPGEYCDQCGAVYPPRTTLCAPPFDVRPHSYTRQHPAHRRADATRALGANGAA